MRISLNKVMVMVAAVVLFGAGTVVASQPGESGGSATYLSGRASTLLAEIQKESAELSPHADALGTTALVSRLSWETHANYLSRVKVHINEIGKRMAELERISNAVHPWQRQAISEVTAHAAQVAASTQAAIVYLNENQGALYVAEYRGHLKTIADSSDDMKQTVDKYVDYEKTQQKLQQLREELEIGSN